MGELGLLRLRLASGLGFRFVEWVQCPWGMAGVSTQIVTSACSSDRAYELTWSCLRRRGGRRCGGGGGRSYIESRENVGTLMFVYETRGGHASARFGYNRG